jgi:hypothetical protein
MLLRQSSQFFEAGMKKSSSIWISSNEDKEKLSLLDDFYIININWDIIVVIEE